MALQIPPNELSLILSLITKHLGKVEVIAFGSRVRGDHHPYSDLDLAVNSSTELSINKLALLEVELKESSLPIKVDIVDLKKVSSEFAKLINKTGIIIQHA